MIIFFEKKWPSCVRVNSMDDSKEETKEVIFLKPRDFPSIDD